MLRRNTPFLFDRWEPGLGQVACEYEYNHATGEIECLPLPWTGMPSGGPGSVLTPEELAAEQSRALDWLAELPDLITTGAKIATLTAAQISAGLKAGAIKESSTCPGGYMLAGGQCVQPQPASSDQWVPFATNEQLVTWGVIAFAGIFLVSLVPRGGGRRR